MKLRSRNLTTSVTRYVPKCKFSPTLIDGIMVGPQHLMKLESKHSTSQVNPCLEVIQTSNPI